MMKVMRKIFCFFVIGAMVFASCGKKTSEKEEKKASDLKTVSVKLNEDAPLYMLSNMTVSGFSINDTTNGIKAKVLMPIKKAKDTTYSIELMSLEAEKVFKESIAQLKEIGKKNEPHNLLIRTVFVTHHNGFLSALFEKEVICAETTSKDSTFFAITYDIKKNTPLKITQVLNIDEQSFEKVISNFTNIEPKMSFSEFESSVFAFGKDSLYIYPLREGKQISVSAPLQSLEYYFINGNKE